MPTNTSDIYDTIVIGAGIAGSSIASALAKKGQKVLLLDRSSVPASGGSGAAGAFVSPKIGKGGPLQQLTNEAFAYAQEFYSTHFPEHFEQSGVVRIPRDDADAEKFPLYEQHNYPNYEKWDGKKLAGYGITDENGGFFFPEAGDCDAPAMCRALAGEVEFRQFDVGILERIDGIWSIGSREQGIRSREEGVGNGVGRVPLIPTNEQITDQVSGFRFQDVGRDVLTPTNDNRGHDTGLSAQEARFMAQEASFGKAQETRRTSRQISIDTESTSAPNKFGVPKNISTHYPLPATHSSNPQQLLTPHSSLLTQNVVLATGYQNDLVDMRYMGIKGLWGSRGDYVTDTDLPVSLHKTISVSSSRDGMVKIGATHNKAPNPCMVCDGNPLAPLIDKASELVDTYDFKLKETFCGMRSGSRDYFPVVGVVVDVEYMLEHYPAITRGTKPPLHYLENLYVLNGLGGRGFVWAPMMAKWLSELIVDGINMSDSVDPDRLFWKWVRKKDK